MSKYHALVVFGLHALSAGWREHLSASAEKLPNLPPLEDHLLRELQAIPHDITLESIRTLHPYLPVAQTEQGLRALVEKGLLEANSKGGYACTPRALTSLQAIEKAVVSCAGLNTILSRGQADRLSVLMTALIDHIAFGSVPIPTPIFTLVIRSLRPCEEPMAQVQQRLVALLAYRDDCHIVAWKAEEYTPPTVRLASYLLATNQTMPLEKFLEVPLFYDAAYVRSALDELTARGEVLETGIGYSLTAKGIMRRERVEQLTEEYFNALFDNHLSDNGRRDWLALMSTLSEATKSTVPIPTHLLRTSQRDVTDQLPG